MKGMKAFLISLTVIIILWPDELKSQKFEGIITYKSVIQRPKNSNMPAEQFNITFKDSVNYNKYYIKNKAYKLVTFDSETDKPTSIDQYDPTSKKWYSYMADDYEFCMWTEKRNDIKITPKIHRDKNDTILILGKKCSSITLDYGVTNITKLYYADAEKVNIDSILNSSTDIYMYISESGAIPLRILMLGSGAPYNIVLTATEIKQEKIDNKIFELPKFKQMMKSPFGQ